MTNGVQLTIKNCEQCPNKTEQRHYTSDPFEMVFEWMCKASNNQRIALQDWNDTPPPIPKWCPLRTKN